MKASIIIPYYNRLNHLKKTIDAISVQTINRNDYEIIVVNDGSDIDPTEFLSSSINIITTPNRGAAAARNTGIHASCGEILIFLDSDIVVEQSFIENHLEFHQRSEAMIGCGYRRHLSSDGALQPLDTREKLLQRYGKKLSELRHPWFMTYTCNVSIAKQVCIRELFDENYIHWGLEDSEWAYRHYLNGVNFDVPRGVSTIHLYHDRAMTEDKFNGWKRNLEYTIRKHPNLIILDVFKDVFNPSKRDDYFQCYDKFEGVKCV